MFNKNTFFGTDGALSLSGVTGVDEAAVAEFIGENGYFGTNGAVARVVNVSLSVVTEIHTFHELGSRAPTELRAGNLRITGTVERAYINGALLRLMLGQYAVGEETVGLTIPTFNMSLILDNQLPAGAPGNSVLNVFGVMFDSWQWNLREDDFALERLSFQAKRVAVTDAALDAS